MTAAQVFTQMKQLVYRKAPCRAFCESKAFQARIDELEKQLSAALNTLAISDAMRVELYTALLNFDVSNMREDDLVNYDLFCQGVYNPLLHGRSALKERTK